MSNFDPGDGKQLGGPLEFRSAIEVAVAIERGRLGLCFYHLSNGSYYDDNPGSNPLVFTIVMDFGR